MSQSAGDDLPHDDAPTFTRTPEQEAMFEENFRLGYIQEEAGVYEMTEALWGWGFDPKDVKQPTDVFYGTSDDIISPEMPMYLAEQLPNSTQHQWEGAGHYGFIDRDRWTQFVTTAKGG